MYLNAISCKLQYIHLATFQLTLYNEYKENYKTVKIHVKTSFLEAMKNLKHEEDPKLPQLQTNKFVVFFRTPFLSLLEYFSTQQNEAEFLEIFLFRIKTRLIRKIDVLKNKKILIL